MADPFTDISQFAAFSPAPGPAAPFFPNVHGRGRVDPTITPPPQLPVNSAAQDALVAGIKDALWRQGRTAVFTCGGRIPMVLDPNHRTRDSDLTPRTEALVQEQRVVTNPVTLRWGDGKAGQRVELPVPDVDVDGQAILEWLARDCTPATFGRDGEDVFDEEYRRAGALAVDEFMTDFCPYKTGIIDLVTQMLVPPVAELHGPLSPQIGSEENEDLDFDQRRGRKRMWFRGLRAELYKLNVYSGPSGHFKAHVDTPRSELQVGSLVVGLPVHFTGGALAVRHEGQEIVHDWGANMEEPAIQWAAFYSDCEHEVMQVTAGHRVTLTYNLYLSPGTGRLCDRALSLQPQRLPIYGQLKSMLAPQDFMLNGGYLGISLVHQYPHTDSVQHKFVPNMLKGAYEAVKAAGLIGVLIQYQRGSLIPALEELDTIYALHVRQTLHTQHRGAKTTGAVANLLTAADIEQGGMEDEDERGDDNPDDMTDEQFMEHLETQMEEEGGGEECLEERDQQFIKEYHAEKEVVWVGTGGNRQMSKVWIAYGNQATLAVKYSSASLIVKIPSWWERAV